MAKALKIDTNGDLSRIDINSLQDLNDAVNGYIELIHFTNIAHAYINEDGKTQNLPHNDVATHLCNKFKIGLMPTDFISGNMVILGNSDDGEENDIPESLRLKIFDELAEQLGLVIYENWN